MLTENLQWNIVYSYFKKKGYVSHQIDTFNDYINNGIQRVVEESDIVLNQPEYKYSISFGQVFIPTPSIIEEDRTIRKILPSEARQRDLTYDVPIYVNILEKIEYEDKNIETEIYEHKRIIIGRTPIMLLSDKCNLKHLNKSEKIKAGETDNDHGGYFLIKGKERVLIGQLRGVYNKPIVIEQKPGEKYKFICEVRCMSEETGHSVLVQAKIGIDDRSLVFNIPYIKESIPMGILFKALGIVGDKEIYNIIGNITGNKKIDKYITYIIRDSYFIKTQEEALMYISDYTLHVIKDDKKINYTSQVVENELLPHMGALATIKEKCFYIGYMVNKLLSTVVGLRSEDDRDNYANKRVEMAGVLCCELFRTLFKRFLNTVEMQIEKKKQRPDIISIISRTNSITSGLKSCFSTGTWSVSKNNYVRSGVSQVLSRLTYGATLSHLRRIMIPIGKEGKNAKIRQIHPSQIMYICPTECFDPETPILTWNGEIKLAKYITIGDILINDEGKPTKVIKTISGTSPMYEINVDKSNFINHIVTSNHILTLKIRQHNVIRHIKKKNRPFYYEVKYFDKNSMMFKYKSFKTEEDADIFSKEIDEKYNDIIDISIKDYEKLPLFIKEKLVIFKCKNILWNKKEVMIDPYILGMWLGDGNSNSKGFTTEDQELLSEWKNYAEKINAKIKLVARYISEKDKKNNKKYTYHSYQINDKKIYRPDISYSITCEFKKLLEFYGLINNKHIPLDYIVNDRETRLKVLAGLIDTDGNVRNFHEIRITQGLHNYRIIEDAFYLATSLGFSCHVNIGKSQWTHYFDDGNSEKRYSQYKELTITGEFLYEIPTKLFRKKLHKFTKQNIITRCNSFIQSKFTLIEKGLGQFVGWQLEGNGRFLLSDCTVSHNTPEGQSIGIVLNMSLMSTVTLRIPTVVVKEIIENSDNIIFINDYEGANDKSRIFLNGILMGITLDKNKFIDEMKCYRDNDLLDKQISLAIEDNDVYIYCDEGRFMRPLLTINDATNRPYISESNFVPDWDELLRQNYIQYIDNSEIQSSVIAMDEKDLADHKNDFCEICPSMMLGVMASTIPFPDHNQCIWYNEPVYMHDGTTKKISDIVVGDRVITFNPKTQEQTITTVTHTYTNTTEKQLFQIITKSGRKITATFDHQFMTNKGWTRLENLNTTDSLIGISLEPKPVSNAIKDINILEIKKGTSILTEQLPIVARIIGYTYFSNVYLSDEYNMTVQVTFTNDNDIQEFEKDLGLLGGINEKPYKVLNKYIYENKLPKLISKFRNIIDVPDWIYNGSDMIKREFIAGFSNFLFNGFNSPSKIFSDKITYMLNSLDIVHCKITRENNNFVYYTVEDKVAYYDTINYRYNYKVKIKKGIYVEYIRNNNMDMLFDEWKNTLVIKSTTIFVPIDKIIPSDENIISDITVAKEEYQSFLCGDAFCVHNSPRNIYQCLCPETDVLMFDGTRKAIKNVKIGDKVITFDPKTLKISTTTVIHQYVRETTQKIYKIKTTSGREIVATENHPFMTPDGWCKVGNMNDRTKIGIYLKYMYICDEEKKLEKKNDCIFVNIQSIQEISNQLISDITVEHENHSFIAGDGFLSSNSSMG